MAIPFLKILYETLQRSYKQPWLFWRTTSNVKLAWDKLRKELLHPPRITPMIRGCGMADLMWRDCSYSAFSFLLFFCSVYICISSAYTSRSCVPFLTSSTPSSVWQDWCSCLMILVRRGYSPWSKHSLPS